MLRRLSGKNIATFIGDYFTDFRTRERLRYARAVLEEIPDWFSSKKDYFDINNTQKFSFFMKMAANTITSIAAVSYLRENINTFSLIMFIGVDMAYRYVAMSSTEEIIRKVYAKQKRYNNLMSVKKVDNKKSRKKKHPWKRPSYWWKEEE